MIPRLLWKRLSLHQCTSPIFSLHILGNIILSSSKKLSTLEKFWKGVQTTKDDRLEGHPMCLEKHWQLHSIPIFVYGDGVEYQTRDTMLVWSWCCFLGDMASMKQHQLLLTAFPKSCTAKDTWPTIWKYLKWSFEALGKGFHPTHGPDGRPLEKGSKLLGKAGQPLHPKGYKAHITNFSATA